MEDGREQRYRQTFRMDFDWVCFNMNLAADRFQYEMKRLAIAIDPSYVSKAGKKTDHIGRFWSRYPSAIRHGLEIPGIALINADIKDAMMLRAVQIQNASELDARNMTLGEWYLSVLKKYSGELLKIISLLVADTAFSNLPFVEGLKKINFSLISRLRSNAVLYYIYKGSRTGKRDRPKTKDDKIDFANPDKSRMNRLDIDRADRKAYELIAWCKLLKQKIRLVIHIFPTVNIDYTSQLTPVCREKMCMTYIGPGLRLSSVSATDISSPDCLIARPVMKRLSILSTMHRLHQSIQQRSYGSRRKRHSLLVKLGL